MTDKLPDITHVALERTDFPYTADRLLWEVIKDRTEALSFRRYSDFIDRVMSDAAPTGHSASAVESAYSKDPLVKSAQATLRDPRSSADARAAAETFLSSKLDQAAAVEDPVVDEATGIDARPAKGRKTAAKTVASTFTAPFSSSSTVQARELPAEITDLRKKIATFGVSNGDAYQLLKAATDFFVMSEAGRMEDVGFIDPPSTYLSMDYVQAFRGEYLTDLMTEANSPYVLPYLNIIRRRLGELPYKKNLQLGVRPDSYGILRSRLMSPVLMELIWNYWIEQGMMVQTMNLISLRFQNVRRGNGLDPLGNFELDPLRPLSNLLWGYVQDELNRLGVNRRSYEYAHGLGLQLVGKAVPEMHPADVRSQFLPAFHDLLRLAWVFFREDDDKTIVADAFPMLNALRELHFVIAEGAHNQFVDLTMRARSEMLMQQWILARPEMKDFLRGRTMVPYPEEWMDRVDAMKSLQQWHDASVINYNDLAVYGEKILLAVRYGNWSTTTDQNQAANWARSFRPEIQRYTHALKIVSSLDLSVGDVVEVRTESERLQQGIVSRTARPGGTFNQPQQPVPRPAVARQATAHVLKGATPAGASANLPSQVMGKPRV
ncbi:MAG: hypothetical protein JWM41_197 [Gemmatimonadetes bacterium]|nr:hypothetical protein [Gemmatimonadota bacterium]